ncbi:molecular chaperone [Shewanella sp. M16]|uniref:fimbrial biogenesis chaperone n=1 Tax=Shewanella sp. M16 TaxID=2830837 RepID=UPI001BB07AAE|nr:fimbria/pilus periplasmic chaperone [Shewanella sp. M16]MBS0041141.1 molecular chaperone [Shewanella sp. M16]
MRQLVIILRGLFITGLITVNAFSITPLTGTRIIFNLPAENASAVFKNNSEIERKINAWVTDIDNKVVENFTVHVSNPLLQAKMKSTITIKIRNKNLISKKQESLYWLNIAEDKNNHTNKITRMKLLVRPQGLAFIDLNKDLIFSEDNKKIMIKNDSAHYITIINLTVNQQERILAEDYLAPFSSLILENSSTQNVLSMNIIQDSGITLNITKHLYQDHSLYTNKPLK